MEVFGKMEENDIQIGTILEGAIKGEEYSYQMYMKAVEMTNNTKVKEILQNLAEQEKMHKEKLQALNFEKLGEEMIPDALRQEDVAAEVELTPVEEFKDIEQLFEFALNMEKRAVSMYEQLLNATTNEEAKSLFETLLREEEGHVRLVEQIQAEV